MYRVESHLLDAMGTVWPRERDATIGGVADALSATPGSACRTEPTMRAAGVRAGSHAGSASPAATCAAACSLTRGAAVPSGSVASMSVPLPGAVVRFMRPPSASIR